MHEVFLFLIFPSCENEDETPQSQRRPLVRVTVPGSLRADGLPHHGEKVREPGPRARHSGDPGAGPRHPAPGRLSAGALSLRSDSAVLRGRTTTRPEAPEGSACPGRPCFLCPRPALRFTGGKDMSVCREGLTCSALHPRGSCWGGRDYFRQTGGELASPGSQSHKAGRPAQAGGHSGRRVGVPGRAAGAPGAEGPCHPCVGSSAEGHSLPSCPRWWRTGGRLVFSLLKAAATPALECAVRRGLSAAAQCDLLRG